MTWYQVLVLFSAGAGDFNPVNGGGAVMPDLGLGCAVLLAFHLKKVMHKQMD